MADPRLERIYALLCQVAETGERDLLRAALSGQGIPWPGEGLDYGDFLHMGLELAPDRLVLAHALTPVVVDLVRERTQELQSCLVKFTKLESQGQHYGMTRDALLEDGPYLYDLFLFCSQLPRSGELFDALYDFQQAGLDWSKWVIWRGPLQQTLDRALAFHQRDERLASYWMRHFDHAQPSHVALSEAEENRFLNGWQGLLWMPGGEGVSMAEAWLRQGLSKAAKRLAHQLDGDQLLFRLFSMMKRTYSRSSRFWVDWLTPGLPEWSKDVKVAAGLHWPQLLGLDVESRACWNAWSMEMRRHVLLEAGDDRWQTLLFECGTKPLVVIGVKKALCGFFGLDAHPATSHTPDRTTAIKGQGHSREFKPPVKETGKHPKNDGSFVRVKIVMESVRRELKRRHFHQAKRFADDLFQEQEHGPAEFLAKSLCQVAAMAKEFYRFDWAVELYERARALVVNDPVVEAGLAEVWCTMGRLEEALRLYQETVERWPDNVVARTGQAAVLCVMGRLDEALEQYQETARQWSDNVVARNGLAEVLRVMGRLDEALEQYQETARQWSDNVVARTGQAEVLRAMGRLDESLEQYQETARQWPDNVVARTGQAEVLRVMGRLDEALEQYRETARQWPDDVVARNGLAEVLQELGRFEEAEAMLRENRQRWPHNRVVPHALANLLRRRGEYAEGLDLVPEPSGGVTLYDQYYLHLRGMIFLERGAAGDWQEAARLFRKGLEQAPNQAQKALCLKGLSLLALKERNYQDALRCVEPLVDSENPDVGGQVLWLHGLAGVARWADARQMVAELTARAATLRAIQNQAVAAIIRAFGLDGAEPANDPDAEEEAFKLEMEMLAAA